MKALVTGAGGQLGKTLAACCPAEIELFSYTSGMLDIGDEAAVERAIQDVAPALIINAAAYTKVDAAEKSSDLADKVNSAGVLNIAQAAKRHHARLVHISTDFVFDGRLSRAYLPQDRPAPLGVYGATKLAGERAAGSDSLIVRTSWLYSEYGQNFVDTMLGLMRQRDSLQVVDDQIGTPTSARSLAQAIWQLAVTTEVGILHYSDSGVASWYDFAVAIMEEALVQGLLNKPISIVPVSSADYPTAALRPQFSVLDKQETYKALGRRPLHWRVNLREILKAIGSNG